MVLNVSAAAVPLMMLQLVAYPVLARYLPEDDYGLMITMYSLWMMVSSTLGNVIFNVRLIRNNDYEEKNIQGDFLVILIQYGVINAAVIAAITCYYNGGFNMMHFGLSLLIASIMFVKAYIDVGFRLVIDFKAVTIAGVFVGLGFLLGSFLAVKTGVWELIYICGYSAGCGYSIVKTGLLKERVSKTELYRSTWNDCSKLTIASVIAHLTLYADKLVLFPILGGKAIAIYYNATILAKIVGMVTGPASGVILTYLSKKKTGSEKSFRKMLYIGLAVAALGYVAVLFVSRPIMGLLYPQWADEIMTYIPVTTINVCILALISMLNPFVLKACDFKWQILISGGGAGVYFATSLIFLKFWGLMGFCIGTVLGSLVRLLLIIYSHSRRRNNEGMER